MPPLVEKPQTHLGLKLVFLFFSITDQMSVSLQGIKTSIDDSYNAVNVYGTC